MSKQTKLVLGVIAIISIAVIVYAASRPAATIQTEAPITSSIPQETTNPSVHTTGTTTTTGTVPTSYTLADIASHKNASSCWTAVNGSVYDVTQWINRHPGGAGAILSLCGTDGSAAFDQQHGGQGRPEQELASFKIGALAK